MTAATFDMMADATVAWSPVDQAVYRQLVRFCREKRVCWPSQETIGKAIGRSAATVCRAVDRLRATGAITMRHRRGSIVYRITDEFWVERGRTQKNPRVSATLCMGANEGKATSSLPSTEPSESLNAARAEENQQLEGWTDGFADAPPDDIEATATAAAPERSSEAALPPREPAARSAPTWRSIERRRGDRPPDGPTLTAYKRKTWEANLGLFVQQEPDAYPLQAAWWKADLAGDEAAKRLVLDEIDDRMRAANWRPPPAIRAKHRLNRRGTAVDPSERERRKQLLAQKVARWVEARFRPGAASDFWLALMKLPPDDAQVYFDKMVAAYRASGWEDRG